MTHLKRNLFISTVACAILAAPIATSQIPFRGTPVSANSQALVVDERGVLTMAPLLEQTTPAVVSIQTLGTESRDPRTQDMRDMMRRFFGDQMPELQERGPRRTSSAGSGVIVNGREGYILTNNHVVEGADEITVRIKDGRVLDAEMVGTDPQTDIAVLKVDARRLGELAFADSETVKTGDYVIAIGNPFGIGQTVTSGIVSALSRQGGPGGANTYQDYIQTDAAINPGNSGGALINSRGELIGINTAIVSRSGGSNGIGYAVPSRIARNVMEQLIENGEVRRGRIGVVIRDVSPDLVAAFDLPVSRGAFVNEVAADTPAERAGLREGDVIVEFNGEEIVSSSDIRNTVGLVRAGTRTDLTYIRDGKRRSTRILVEALPESESETVRPASSRMSSGETMGFSGATITDIPDGVELRDGIDGVYVSEVERTSRAARGGLRAGDIIREVRRQPVTTVEEFEDAVDGIDGPTGLKIDRRGSTLYLAIR